MKKCTRCGLDKSLDQFHKEKVGRKGVRSQCKLCAETLRRARIASHPERHRAQRAITAKRFNDTHPERQRDYQRIRYATNLTVKLARRLRSRTRSALKNGQKAGSAVRDLGCSIPELRLYLESKFQSGMSWDNYGEWHIDHVKPLAKFDLTDRAQLLEACRYTNLQPLWAEDNRKKAAE
jgi:hypothetical protein